MTARIPTESEILEALDRLRSSGRRRFHGSEYQYYVETARAADDYLRNSVPAESMLWFGLLAMQWPTDLLAYAEILHAERPTVVVETGTCGGGSAQILADMLRHVHSTGRFEVVTCDPRDGAPADGVFDAWPEVTLYRGSSLDPEFTGCIEAALKRTGGQCMVTLDSDHSARHVAREIAALGRFVTIGQYLIVQDTTLGFTRSADSLETDYTNEPLGAVEALLDCSDCFEVDPRPHRWLLTQHPFGYLRRVS